MSDLKTTEKLKLEKFFEMDDGYVCDFNNRTFKEFVLESTGIDAYTDEYETNGTSKASRLRLFWKKESNFLNAKLLSEMIDYWKTKIKSPYRFYEKTYRVLDKELCKECLDIVSRLKNSGESQNMDILKIESIDKNFSVLIDLIKEDMRKDRHEYTIDRLHTLVVKYVRELCQKHSISFTKESPIHAVFGQYVKFLRDKGLIKSQITMKILGSTIKILDEFNDVRNNQSFAHDNDIVNHTEGVLITNNIINGLLFVNALEKTLDERMDRNIDDEEPFTDEEIEAAADLYLSQLEDIARGK